MARVSARQAFTRAKSKRQKSKAESQKAMVEARIRYVQQLANVVRVPVDKFYESERSPRNRPREATSRRVVNSGHKKITDYFSVTKNLDLMHRVVKAGKPITSTSLDPNGVEIITIYDSEHEDMDDCDSNNNNNNSSTATTNDNNSHISSDKNNDDANNNQTKLNNENLNNSLWDSSFESGYDQSTLSVQNQDVKPLQTKLDITNLGASFEDLKLKVQIDEDIEIVDMLPPIPLRNHPVFEVDE